MPEKRNKCNILDLKVQKQYFLTWFEQTKKISSFGKGSARWMFCIRLCRNHLLWTYAARILWKSAPWDIFARLPTAKCIAISNHNVSLEDDYCVPFFDLKFFIPTLRHMFCSPNPLNIYGEQDFVSWKNLHFCDLKKETFISDGRYKWILPKNMLSSSLVDITFLRTFLL